MSEWLDSIRNSFNERLSNPFWGAFIASWCIANYPVFIFAFSDLHPQIKIYQIAGVPGIGLFGVPYLNQIFPVVVGLLYVYAYPFLARKMTLFWLRQQTEYKNERLKQEGITPWTPEEVEELKHKYDERHSNILAEFDRISDKSESQARRLDERDRAIDDLTSRNKQQDTELESLRVEKFKFEESIAKEKQTIKSLTNTLSELQKQVNSLTAALAKRDARIKSLQEPKVSEVLNPSLKGLAADMKKLSENPVFFKGLGPKGFGVLPHFEPVVAEGFKPVALRKPKLYGDVDNVTDED